MQEPNGPENCPPNPQPGSDLHRRSPKKSRSTSRDGINASNCQRQHSSGLIAASTSKSSLPAKTASWVADVTVATRRSSATRPFGSARAGAGRDATIQALDTRTYAAAARHSFTAESAATLHSSIHLFHACTKCAPRVWPALLPPACVVFPLPRHPASELMRS